MKFDLGTRSAKWWKEILHHSPQSGQDAAVPKPKIGELTRQGLAVVLSALMITIPIGRAEAFGQSNPPAPEDVQPGPQGQPLSAEQLKQLVAPIALYPDPLVAQVLAAATYPAQVVEADRWRQAQGNVPAEQIAAGAEAHNWDPSVKALTAFPTVLAQLDKNIQWTTDLGNAYYNQPQDVMDSVQAMRHKAQAAGQLRSTPQQVVANAGGAITIAPANPRVVYVPVYNPWVVYGAPFPPYPGFYYYPPPGIFGGGLAIGFGIGIGIGVFAHWGWGWGHWGMGWQNHAVFYNHNTYITRSTTVINRGFNRPGGPPRNVGARGAYARRVGGFNRAGVNRASAGSRGAFAANRPGGSNGRPGEAISRSSASSRQPAGNNGRPSGGPGARAPRAASRGSGAKSGGSHASGSSGHSGGQQGHAAHKSA